MTERDKLAHCACTVAALRCVTQKLYSIWLFCANDQENNTQKDQNKIIRRYEAFFCQAANIFISLVFEYHVGRRRRRGLLLFSSAENKQSSKSGRNAVVLFVWKLQVAALTGLRSPPTTLLSDPVICSLLPPHAPTFPLLSLSLLFLPEQCSILLCLEVPRLWRTSFHCIRNWYLNACEVTVKSVFGCVDWKVMYAQYR